MHQLAALEQQGARRYQPARFRYLESLAQRLTHSRLPAIAQQRKLDHALTGYRVEFLQARENAEALVEQLAQSGNGLCRDTLQQHLDGGDFKTLRRLAARQQLPPSPLIQLLNALRADNNITPQTEPASALDTALHQQRSPLQHNRDIAPGRELKALRRLRATQARLHTQQRIHHALAQTPGDAGPLNAHRQIARTIETLRDISPTYLEQLVVYMDALMVLEKVGKNS